LTKEAYHGSRRSNSKIADAVAIIGQIGPDIPEIAGRLHEHKETVRYWYKKLERKGFVVQASANYEKLGLKRMVAVVDFSEEYESQAEGILEEIGKLSYVQSIVRTVPENYYIISGEVPEEFVGQWIDVIKRLREGGLFSNVEFTAFDRTRNVSMKSEMYDFESDRWEFDWSTSTKVYPDTIERASFGSRFDKTDLEIIRAMQLDASEQLVDIQKETGINYKTLCFHSRAHVIGRRLLTGYRVNWMGTHYHQDERRSENRRHKYQRISIIVRDISESDIVELMGMTNAVPFLWWEAWGQNYYAQMAFPTETFSEAMLFLSKVLAPFKDRARWFLIDQSHSMAFPITPELFDEPTRKWKFDQAKTLAQVDQLLLRARGASLRSRDPSSRSYQ
jgi:DNA-binding Lrp family transcriptional regulator